MTALTFFDVTGDFHAVDDPDLSSSSSDANIEAVQGLVSFTPRLAKGFTAYVDGYQISGNSNNKQTVTLIGAITGGLWGLNFNGVWMNPYIAPGSTTAQVQAALAAMSTIGAGNVLVTGATGGPYHIELVGALAAAPQTQMLSDASQLDVSSGSPHVSVVMDQMGSASRTLDTAISLPVRHGRIWTTGQLCSINVADSPNVELVANADLGIDFDLLYDVAFTAVRFNDVSQTIAPFAFKAPIDNTPVCITDPSLERFPYFAPIQETWYPGWEPKPPPVFPAATVTQLPGWRERARTA